MNNNIISDKTSQKFLFPLVLFIAFAYVVGHTYFAPVLYLAVVLTFALFVYYNKYIIYLVAFFVPMARIMKFSPNGLTFLNWAIIFALLAIILANDCRFNTTAIFSGVALLLLLLMKNLLTNFGFSFSYVRVAIFLILIPQVFSAYKRKKIDTDIMNISRFLFWGVVFSVVIGMIYADHPGLVNYLVTDDTHKLGKEVFNRFCGLSNDPNYFSSFVAFALAMQLYCLTKTIKVKYVIGSILLTLMGTLTLSKMYLLIAVVIWILSVVNVWKASSKQKDSGLRNILILCIVFICILLMGNFLSSSGYFDIMFDRFTGMESGLTTGRADSWKIYIDNIFDSLEIFTIGAPRDSLVLGHHVTHNTFVQIWWKFGLAGIIIIFAWFIALYRDVKISYGFYRGSFLESFPILLSMILPLLALDKLIFDEAYWFFIIYLFVRINTSEKIATRGNDQYEKNISGRSNVH